MNNPHSLPDSTAQATENNFLFSDWEVPEKNPTNAAAPFDGKIIARMPDLGSEGFANNIEIPKVPLHWKKIGSTVLPFFQGLTHPQFLHRFTAVGCVVLLCGIVFLLLERENKKTENDTDIIQIISEDTGKTKKPASPVGEKTTFDTVLHFGPGKLTGNPTGSTIPVAPVESVALAAPPVHADSVWDRPVGDPYSPFGVPPRQLENPPNAAGNAAAAPSFSPVTMSPMIDMTTSMPVSPYEIPIFPYEQQLVAQSSPQVHPPVDPFLQQSGPNVPGMIPMRGQVVGNTPGSAATQNVQRSVTGTPYVPEYVPQSVVQGVHPSYHQQNPYAAPPQNMPIPSAASTLPPQGHNERYYNTPPQNNNMPHGTTGQRVPSEFYNTPPIGRVF